MGQPDASIHQPVRLKIMAALRALPRGEAMEFTRLRAAVGASDGNLGAHLTHLERAGYVIITKDFYHRKPRTRVTLSPAGRRAFESYVDYLRELIEATEAVERN
ncbi:MAG: winged helix-turn-helix domain-containing protein [Terriglobales bacterium]